MSRVLSKFLFQKHSTVLINILKKNIKVHCICIISTELIALSLKASLKLGCLSNRTGYGFAICINIMQSGKITCALSINTTYMFIQHNFQIYLFFQSKKLTFKLFENKTCLYLGDESIPSPLISFSFCVCKNKIKSVR